MPAGAHHGRALRRAAQAGARPMTDTALPDPATFSSGVHGTVGGKRGTLRRLGDKGLDGWLVLSGTRHRMLELAAHTPRRDVLVATLYSPGSRWIGPALDEIRA